jgi:hypothetical protein
MKGMFTKSSKVKGGGITQKVRGGKGSKKRRVTSSGDDRLDNLHVHGNRMMPLPTKSWHRLHAA